LGRARKVADLLVVQGIDPNILEIESHGEDNLLVKTGDEVREPRNRRVEITVW
jgi:outer membrane protein OmpA-like peptidoglycan-associated protein